QPRRRWLRPAPRAQWEKRCGDGPLRQGDKRLVARDKDQALNDLPDLAADCVGRFLIHLSIHHKQHINTWGESSCREASSKRDVSKPGPLAAPFSEKRRAVRPAACFPWVMVVRPPQGPLPVTGRVLSPAA